MEKSVQDAFENVFADIAELQKVQAAHRGLISQHQAALKSIAQIMEGDRGLDTPL